MSIATLVGLGGDQVLSQYEILYPNGIPGSNGANTSILTLRQDQTFPWPTRETGTYDIFYQGQKITKTSVVEATDKSFQLAFRLDQNWLIFQYLNNWFKLCYDEFYGTADNEENTRVPMVVRALGPLKQVAKTATFHGVKIKSLKITDFDHTQGETARIDVGFIYYYSTFE